jgi:hypothetical protein
VIICTIGECHGSHSIPHIILPICPEATAQAFRSFNSKPLQNMSDLPMKARLYVAVTRTYVWTQEQTQNETHTHRLRSGVRLTKSWSPFQKTGNTHTHTICSSETARGPQLTDIRAHGCANHWWSYLAIFEFSDIGATVGKLQNALPVRKPILHLALIFGAIGICNALPFTLTTSDTNLSPPPTQD